MDGIVALLVRYAFIVGLLVWLLNTPQRLATIPASIKKIGSTISGQDISFGSLISLFSEVVNPLVGFTNGLGWTDIGLIMCMTFIIFLINCLFFLIASTVLVVEIEAVFILIGGLFTASFFVIGYFRDTFLSYIKALAAVGVKMLMLCLCLGAVRNIMATWPGMIASQLDNAESIFSFLMPMACALLGFYMLLRAVPQFASSIMTGSASGMDGGAVRAAAAAGYGLGMTAWNTSRTMAQGVMGTANTVSQAAQAYSYTSQAARDTGSTSSEARSAGAWEAFKTIMTGPQAGGSHAGGERIYSDHQRDTQFVDVRNANDAASNAMSAPNAVNSTAGVGGSSVINSDNGSDGTNRANVRESEISTASASTSPAPASNQGRGGSAGPYITPSSQRSAFEPAVNSGRAAAMSQPNLGSAGNGSNASERAAQEIYDSPDSGWGFASDRRKEKDERS
jgi:hypothetical protein